MLVFLKLFNFLSDLGKLIFLIFFDLVKVLGFILISLLLSVKLLILDFLKLLSIFSELGSFNLVRLKFKKFLFKIFFNCLLNLIFFKLCRVLNLFKIFKFLLNLSLVIGVLLNEFLCILVKDLGKFNFLMFVVLKLFNLVSLFGNFIVVILVLLNEFFKILLIFCGIFIFLINVLVKLFKICRFLGKVILFKLVLLKVF